jgi:hypothetical protein
MIQTDTVLPTLKTIQANGLIYMLSFAVVDCNYWGCRPQEKRWTRTKGMRRLDVLSLLFLQPQVNLHPFRPT